MKEIVTVNVKANADVSPVAMLVQLASRFESDIYIVDGSKRFNAKSIMGMMTLGLANGQKLEIDVEGEDEETAINEVVNFLSGK